jgi:peptidoglycan hydrolase-like amidase
MCQEGAMYMAQKGYKFDEIIKYYYKGAEIVALSKLKK